MVLTKLRASLVTQSVKSLPAIQETRVLSLGQEDPLEKEMATHPGILAWRIPWTEEPGRLQPMGVIRVGHDLATKSPTKLNINKNQAEMKNTITDIKNILEGIGTSLVVQGLRLCAPNKMGPSSIPGQGLDFTCHN